MSVRVLGKVLREETTQYGDRLVLIALADAASDDGVTWESQEQLAAKARLSNSQTRKCLDALAEASLIERRKAQRGRRRINVYRVLMPGLPEVDYDRLPFKLDEPFATADIERSSKPDDRRSARATTADLGSRVYKDPLEEPLEEPSALARREEPPKLVKIDGRNLAFDALSEECRADPDARGSEIAAALKKISVLYWRDLPERTRTVLHAEHPDWSEPYTMALANEIRRKARIYDARMSGAVLTPTALAKWWVDIEKVPASGRSTLERVTPEEMLRQAKEAREEGR